MSSNLISERRYYLKYNIFMESRAHNKLDCPEGSVYIFPIPYYTIYAVIATR